MNRCPSKLFRSSTNLQVFVRNKWLLRRENQPFLDEPKISPYIVGPYIKEIIPEQPWLIPRAGVDNVYEELGNTLSQEPKPIKVILIDHVPGVGLKGDIVEVDREYAFRDLVLTQRAVYANDKNMELYKNLLENKFGSGPSTPLSGLTAIKLAQTIFLIKMSGEGNWILNKAQVQANLRLQGLTVPLEAIELPLTKITGPDLKNEGKDFFIYITINNNPNERIKVRCMLHHLNVELSNNWNSKNERELINEE